ncbi:MAG: hypothetical protein DRP79_05425 [Planctomycetota bacterium]|nr:MAG: hypothetical protein DRP79_05425 [Planctomycetota bacterium]
MISKKINKTFLPFVVIAVAIAVTLLLVLSKPVAQSEEGEDNDGGPYGVLPDYGSPPKCLPAQKIFRHEQPKKRVRNMRNPFDASEMGKEETIEVIDVEDE